MQSNQRGVVGTRNLNMTDVHRAGLQQLKERDAKIVRKYFGNYSFDDIRNDHAMYQNVMSQSGYRN
jgi:hypothetical protein